MNKNLLQFDGNISVDSVYDNSELNCSCGNVGHEDTTSSYNSDFDEPSVTIPVHLNLNRQDQFQQCDDPPAWFDEYQPRVIDKKQSKVNRITIRRDNRLMMNGLLPIISVSNMRSLHPKLGNFKTDMLEREISVALLSEVWEKATCKKQRAEVESMFQIEGLKYISTPRLNKRGGGAAIVVSLQKYSLDKIEINNPDRVEVVWGLMRPRKLPARFKEIIVAAFYSPPKSPKNPLLLDHLVSNSQSLLTKYPNAALVIGGDKNNLNLSPLLCGIPRIRQIVTKSTHKFKILDVILTNMHQLYSVPTIAPPVPPDNPLWGKPSEHSTPIATPLCLDNIYQPKEYVIKVARPLPDSGMREFGQWICTEEWADLPDNVSPTEQVLKFEQLVTDKLNMIFPQKTVRLTVNLDHPFITAELKTLDRQVKRIYRKQNKSDKYWRLKNAFNEKFKIAAAAYLEKNVRSLKEDNPGTAYRNLKKLGAQPGDCSTEEGSFTLLFHLEENLSREESIERIAQHFAQISQEFPPLDYNLLSESVKVKLDKPVHDKDIPIISEYEVYEKIRK